MLKGYIKAPAVPRQRLLWLLAPLRIRFSKDSTPSIIPASKCFVLSSEFPSTGQPWKHQPHKALPSRALQPWPPTCISHSQHGHPCDQEHAAAKASSNRSHRRKKRRKLEGGMNNAEPESPEPRKHELFVSPYSGAQEQLTYGDSSPCHTASCRAPALLSWAQFRMLSSASNPCCSFAAHHQPSHVPASLHLLTCKGGRTPLVPTLGGHRQGSSPVGQAHTTRMNSPLPAQQQLPGRSKSKA